jgi:nitrite reductase (NADH) small subunit
MTDTIQDETTRFASDPFSDLLRPEAVGAPDVDWVEVCPLADLEPGWAEAALVAGEQVALVRVNPDELYAVSHRDPATGACVIARGIVGSKGDRPTIASPLHKEVYDLRTGRCFGNDGLQLATYPVRVHNGMVAVAVAMESQQAA